jgi:hypothetical protein
VHKASGHPSLSVSGLARSASLALMMSLALMHKATLSECARPGDWAPHMRLTESRSRRYIGRTRPVHYPAASDCRGVTRRVRRIQVLFKLIPGAAGTDRLGRSESAHVPWQQVRARAGPAAGPSPGPWQQVRARAGPARPGPGRVPAEFGRIATERVTYPSRKP